ncbi:reverse transcriptase domain-containing protein [Tanacetum coccineum]
MEQQTHNSHSSRQREIVTRHPCSKLAHKYEDADPRQIPTEILNIKGQKHIFQIRFSSFTRKGSCDFAGDDILDKPEKPTLSQGTSSNEKKVPGLFEENKDALAPGHSMTDEESVGSASHTSTEGILRPQLMIFADLLPDKGPTLTTTTISEILGNPSTELPYNRSPLTHHKSNRGVRPHDHQEKVQQEKLKAVKARLNFENTSRHFESGTSSTRRSLKERLGPRYARSMSGSPEPRRGHSKSPREKGPERRTVFKRLEKGVFHRLGDKEKNVSAHSRDSRHRPYHSSSQEENSKLATRVLDPEKQNLLPKNIITKEHPRKERKNCQKVKAAQEDIGSQNRRSKSRALRTTCPNHGSEDPKDHLKIFQAATKTERWAITWCHMFNSTLTENARVWFDDLSQESIDSYDDLRKAFLENYLQQKKCIKDPVEIHNIKQRDGESTEEFVRRYKLECRDVKGAPECMKISGFMHGITNPELIKRLHDKIPMSIDEMMRVTTAFLRGEVTASNLERKKSFSSWKQQELGQKQNFKKGNFRNQQRTERKQDRFTLLTKTPKEILALDKGKFKPPPPMTTLVEKRNASKFYEFHGEVGHTTDECMHLKRQIEEMLKARKMSHLIKELKQNNEKDQAKVAKKGETSRKDKSLAILMVQPWQRVARQKITQTFSSESVISFPPLGEEDGTEDPMIIEAEMGGHCVHRMYVDGGSSSEILYEHCFNRFRLEVRNQMIPATTPLVGFSAEIIWPLGQISLPIKIGDEEHSTST